MTSDDKPKRSWREIDRKRDIKQSRDNEPKTFQGNDTSHAYRAYKSKLNQLFNTVTAAPETKPEVAYLKALEDNDKAAVVAALIGFLELQQKGELKASPSLKAKIRAAQMNLDDADVDHLVMELLQVL